MPSSTTPFEWAVLAWIALMPTLTLTLTLTLALAPGARAATPMSRFYVSPPLDAFALERNEMVTVHGTQDNPIMTVFLYLSNVTLFQAAGPFESVPSGCCTLIGAKLPAAGMTFDVYGSIESIDTHETINKAIASWRDAADLPSLTIAQQIFSPPAFATDGQTTLSFGAIEPANLQSAVGVVRIVFSGSTIAEWDMIINIEKYEIGDASLSSLVFDAWQLMGHEFGHVFGLGDIYTSSCSESAMYGYISSGDTTKRTIDEVSLDCVSALYDPSIQGEGASKHANRSGIVHSICMFVIVVALVIV